jgi:galactokinase
MEPLSGAELVRSEFDRNFGKRPGDWPRLYQAPGRINIIGEHTDYNGGFVLPSSIDLHTWVASSPRNDRMIRVFDCHAQTLHSLDLDDLEQGTRGEPVEYFKAVAWVLQDAGMDLTGADMVVAGNIPIGGGLSSSASLELTLALALLDGAGLDMDREALALLCQRAESEFVGAQCGIMDQFSVALAARGRAMLLDCQSREIQLVDIPAELCFLIVHSGVHHRVSTGSYNSRREECERAVRKLSGAVPGLHLLRQLGPEQLEVHKNLLDETLYRRARHVVTENQRVLDAVDALQKYHLARLGSLVSQSHRSLRDDYEVSCAELDQLVEIALACEGVYGSRMMGAGFGGCTISLLEPDAVEEAARRIEHEYAPLLGRKPWIHVARPSDSLKRLQLS